MATISHLDEFRADSTTPVTPDLLRHAELPAEKRGYSREAVIALLSSAANALEEAERDLVQARSRAPKKAIESIGKKELMGLVGENVAEVLSEAQQSADQLKRETEAHAKQLISQANETSERIVSEAQSKGLAIREAAQESADSMLAEARRDKDAIRGAAEEAAAVLRAQAKSDADQLLSTSQATSSEMTRAATDEARELREATDREARRHVQEAREIASAKMKAAEAQAGETVEAAKARAADIETELSKSKKQGEAAVQQLSQARDVLTARLTSTHNGLVQLLAQVADGNGLPLLSVEEQAHQSPSGRASVPVGAGANGSANGNGEGAS
ncbi:MAG: hypothetical protein ACR2N6_04870 [Miltoncostaeaceae bacterium]